VPGDPVRSVRDLLALVYGAPLHTDPFEADFTVGTTAVRIAQPNVRRTEIIVTNWGAAAIAIGMTNTVTATTGWIVGSNNWGSFVWWPDLDLTIAELWAISAGAGNAVHVLERLLRTDT